MKHLILDLPELNDCRDGYCQITGTLDGKKIVFRDYLPGGGCPPTSTELLRKYIEARIESRIAQMVNSIVYFAFGHTNGGPSR